MEIVMTDPLMNRNDWSKLVTVDNFMWMESMVKMAATTQ